MSFDMQTKSLNEILTHTKNDCEEARRMKAEIMISEERMEAKMEATRRKFWTQFKEVGAWQKSRRGRGTGAGMAEALKFDGTTLWAVFWCQFKTVAEHNCWACQEKSTYLIIALQGRATEVLHGVLKGVTYEETLEALEDRIWDQHMAAAYGSWLKSRTQGVGESLQIFATAVEWLAHCAYTAVPEDHIRREAGKGRGRRPSL
jgi:hypothetical protein